MDDTPAHAPPDPAHVAARLAAIMEATPAYWRDPAAWAEAAALWGGCREDGGVFAGREHEQIARLGMTHHAAVLLARSPNGLWANGVEAKWGMGGFGSMPAIWSEPFASRDARRAAIRDIAERLTYPDNDRKRVELLRRVKAADTQRGLFD